MQKCDCENGCLSKGVTAKMAAGSEGCKSVTAKLAACLKDAKV
jgi:hypothetical protein